MAVTSTFLGNALLISVEKESMIIRLVFGGGNVWVGCARRAMRWARDGVEKWVRFERRSGSLSISRVGDWGVIGLKEDNIWESRDPDTG